MVKKDSYELEILIAKLLRVGVLLSAVLLAIGWISELSFTTDTFTQFQSYQTVPLQQILATLTEQKSWGLLTAYAGLFVLISLPLIRVLLTGLLFLKDKEYLLATIVGVVLLGLGISFSLGFEI